MSARTVRRLAAQARRAQIADRFEQAMRRTLDIRDRMEPGSISWQRADTVACAHAHRATAWTWLAAGAFADQPARYVTGALRSRQRSYDEAEMIGAVS